MSAKKIPRRQAIPILYTRGTHYDVGFDMVSYFHSDSIIRIISSEVRELFDIWLKRCLEADLVRSDLLHKHMQHLKWLAFHLNVVFHVTLFWRFYRFSFLLIIYSN